jgi:hypothetical protein
MATVSASNFSTNSLVGTTIVRNGFANISLPLTPYVLEGDKDFTVKLRKDSVSGTILVSVPTQTIRDNSAFVSLTANTSSINEDGLVTYTLVMANAANNANLYYSVIPMSANVTQSDFFANTGVVTIINNQAVFTVRANVDAGYADETGEAFRLQLRQNGPTGNIFFTTTANVAIVDTYKLTNYISLIESATAAAESDIVTFTFTAHNVAPGTVFYYDTVGNVTSSTFSSGNTGSFVMNSTSNVILLTGATQVPANETRFYQLNVRSGNANGFVAMTSNVITLVDDAAAFVAAAGGIEYINDGYKTHVFTSSNNFVISGLGVPSNRNLYYEIVAAGGAGGYSPSSASTAGGGGAGGFLRGNTSLSTTGTFAMVVGGGAVDNIGSNSSILSNTFIAIGGGFGGRYGVPPTSGQTGGSGGGAGLGGGGGSGTPGQGNPGANAPFANPSAYGAGGGGAGAAANTSVSPGVFGKAGDGLRSVSIANIPAQSQPLYGTPGSPAPGRWLAGGGAAGGGAAGAGLGGGGYPPSPTAAGIVNTGGGGGGLAPGTSGGAGGSGIVIVRYPYTVATYGLIDNVGLTKVVTDNTTITYSLTTINVANTSTLYWTLSGNVANTDVRNGNTGSFTVLNSNATFSVSLANNIVSGNDTKEFTLQLRKNSVNGGIVATAANTITVYAGSTRSNFISATGGTIVDTGSYRLHVFTSSNTLVVSDAGRMGGYVDYLTVSGGGGGGGRNLGNGESGSGGGAGGLLTGITTVSAQTYVANVGAGGTAGAEGTPGGNGGNTNIFSISTIGGGGGTHTLAGRFGGSGSGAMGSSSGSVIDGGSGITGQGYPGGSTPPGNPPPSPGQARGGGGAGAAGGLSGGNGLPISWIPSSYGTSGPTTGRWFAGGGGGGSITPGVAVRLGGAGGGGQGGNFPSTTSFGGNVNTGGGGGGGGPTTGAIGTGGSGIIIIRYPYV